MFRSIRLFTQNISTKSVLRVFSSHVSEISVTTF